MSRLHTASRRIAVMGEPADPAIHRAMREARTEAVVVLGLDVALLAGLATLDHTQGWAIIGLPWWAWLLVACPPAMMIAALLVFPLAEVSPGRVRNVTVGLLGLLVLGDAAAIAVLLVALAGADGDDLSAATSSRTGPSSGSATSSSSACCSGCSTTAARGSAPRAAATTPTSSTRRTYRAGRAGRRGSATTSMWRSPTRSPSAPRTRCRSRAGPRD
jgi:hypothetical protein